MINNIEAINANPEEIYKFLSDSEYVIPDYQRPYSWGTDESIRLWEDLIDFYHESKLTQNHPPYFLGNVVIYNETDSKRVVVDGQQRLITLSILMRVLWDHCKSYKNLQKTLYLRDRKDDTIKEPKSLRIEHNVLGELEENGLKTVLIRDAECVSLSKYEVNYQAINEKVNELFQKLNSDETEKIIETILFNVVLLPIKCTDFESALTIFETINNRGMDLSDADIIKSKLYKLSKTQKDEFIIRWNDALDNAQKNNMELQQVFYQYMHVLRGKEKNIDNVIGLRKFFNLPEKISDWTQTMKSIEKLIWGWSFLTTNSEENGNSLFNASSQMLNWFKLLEAYPNDYWQYPIMVFMHEKINENESGNFHFPNKYHEELECLLKETAKYCYAKWLKHRGVTSIKFTIFKVVRDIIHSNSYLDNYKDDIINDIIDINNFKTILSNKFSSLNRGRKGICFLSALLNNQISAINDDIQIEHILPEKYERFKYDEWDEGRFARFFDTLGNVVILERENNIRASNQFFQDKKIEYSKSTITEVRELTKLSNWTPQLCSERQKKVVDRLISFFNY